MSIRTTHSRTISMTLEQGELFAKANVQVAVLSKRTNKKIGTISSSFFNANKYIRTKNDGESVFYVSPFVRD